jgi:DNA-binding response OmpR family regulator
MAESILIIEDDASIARVTEGRLAKAGYDVMLAHDGEEGLKVALAEHPDLIIADVLMPKMNGLQMIQELRKDAWGKDADVIVLSNSDDVNHVSTVLAHDVFTYWVKANVIAEIEKKVEEHLVKRKKK